MKFFTLDGWIADQDIGNVDINDIISARKAYNDYLASIADELPPEFTRLGQTIHLGDARLRELDVDLPAKRITLVLDAEDLATGESRGVALLYDEVRRFVSTSDPDKGLPGHTATATWATTRSNYWVTGSTSTAFCSRRASKWPSSSAGSTSRPCRPAPCTARSPSAPIRRRIGRKHPGRVPGTLYYAACAERR